jgi:hypothetical protein
LSTTGATGVGVSVLTGAGVIGVVGVTSAFGVTTQLASKVAPLGVVVGACGVTGAGVTGAGACVCQACGVTLVQTAGISQALAIF